MKKATIRSVEPEKRVSEQPSEVLPPAALPSLGDLLAGAAPKKLGRHADPLRALDLSAPPQAPVRLDHPRKKPVTLGDLGLAVTPKDQLLAFATSLASQRRLSKPELAGLLRGIADELAPEPATVAPTTALPAVAPELWAKRDLNRRETPPQFIARAYARWLGRGLSRKDLKNLDPDLYRALSVWLTRHPEDDIAKALPRKSDKLDDLIDKLAAEHSLEDLRKLGYAIDARLKRESKRQKSP